MKKYYEVSIKYNDGIFGSNIAFAENENDIKAHYEAKGYEVIASREVSERTVESARERGKPIVTIESIKELKEEIETRLEKTAVEYEWMINLALFNDSWYSIWDMVENRADELCDIYTSDLKAWLNKCPSSNIYMEQAVEEGYIAIDKYDFIKHIMSAQYLYYCDSLNETLNDEKLFTIYYHLWKFGNSTITEKQKRDIEEASKKATMVDDLVRIINKNRSDLV